MRLKDKNLYSRLPETPGVYIFRGSRGKILYIGKAGNLKKRVSSYFLRPHDRRIERLVSEIRSVSVKRTPSALEALILESALIKKLQPPWNVREKDDKSFLYLEIAKERYPRVLLVRGKSPSAGKRYGPFTSPGAAREAMRLLRKLFPWSTHAPKDVGRLRPCLDYQIGLCPGTCFGAVSEREYRANIRNLELFLAGKRALVTRNIEREMKKASGALEFERAAKLRRQLFGLRHIQDSALITAPEFRISNLEFRDSVRRIEGYDISNISGTDPVGVMVVFSVDVPKKSDYRKFLIKTVTGSNDVGMLREVIRRRFAHVSEGEGLAPSLNERGGDRPAQERKKGGVRFSAGWDSPDLILVDGGKPQVNAVRDELKELGLSFPLVGIAKGPARKKNEFHGNIPVWVSERTLIRVRDEAHRFAISFHRARRSVRMRK